MTDKAYKKTVHACFRHESAEFTIEPCTTCRHHRLRLSWSGLVHRCVRPVGDFDVVTGEPMEHKYVILCSKVRRLPSVEHPEADCWEGRK